MFSTIIIATNFTINKALLHDNTKLLLSFTIIKIIIYFVLK